MNLTPLLLTGLLAPVAYNFRSDTKLDYTVNVHFEGFLPLMGGHDGNVDITMGVGVSGLEPEGDNLRASSEINEFKLLVDGQKLPLGLESVVGYFPKTTVSLTGQGKILTSDAPDKTLPVRLPGLDVKHFPDITYIPIELPGDGLEVGKEWTFKRDFGGAPIEYTCKAESLDKGTWKLHVNLKQSFTTLENSSIEVVKNKDDAVNEVTTTMTGDGNVEFDGENGRVTSAEMTNTAIGEVKSLTDGTTTNRKLVTKYVIRVKGAQGAKPVAQSTPPASAGNWWDKAVEFSTHALQNGKVAVMWVQTAALFGLKALPAELEAWTKPLMPYLRRWAPWLGS